MTHKNLPIYLGASQGFAETLTIDSSPSISQSRRLLRPYTSATPPNAQTAYSVVNNGPTKTKIKIQGFAETGLLSELVDNSQINLQIATETYDVYVDSYSFTAAPNQAIKININATRLDTGVMTIPSTGGTPYSSFPDLYYGHDFYVVDNNAILNNTVQFTYSQNNTWSYVYNTDQTAYALVGPRTRTITFESTGIRQGQFQSVGDTLLSGLSLLTYAGPIAFNTTSSMGVSQESWGINDNISVQTTFTEDVY